MTFHSMPKIADTLQIKKYFFTVKQNFCLNWIEDQKMSRNDRGNWSESSFYNYSQRIDKKSRILQHVKLQEFLESDRYEIESWNFGYPGVSMYGESNGDNNFWFFKHRFYDALSVRTGSIFFGIAIRSIPVGIRISYHYIKLHQLISRAIFGPSHLID